MDESHRRLLNDHLVDLVTDLDPTKVYAHLIQGKILSADDVESINAQLTRKDKAMELMNILPRKGPDAFEVFTEALKETHPHLHQLLLESAGSTSCTVSADVFANVQCELRRRYTSCLKDMYTIPWLQEFLLDLTKVYIRLRLQTIGRLQKKWENVTQDEIFVPRQKVENPTRILVEGDPGIGKSTLCQKLAFNWSSESCGEQCCSPCIHSFELVVYLTAADFRGYKDVSSVIHAHLLPKDSQISVNAFGKALRNRNVLFIVDGFDEACTENPLLHDLIQGRIAVQSTILLTSRPNYLREMLKCFDEKLYVDGFDAQQRREYVKKFAQHAERPLSEFQNLLEERNELTALCCTPLNMAIVCLMSTMDDTSFNTRTELYQSVHEFILKKASDRLNLSHEVIELTIIDPLCKLSFEAYQKGEAVLMEGDLMKVCSDPEPFCRAGYLIKKLKVSRLRCEIRFSFSHRTFQEFLSAIHIKQLPEPERQEWLKAVDLRQNESIVSFLFGVLENNEEALLQIASNIIDRTFLSIVNPLDELKLKCPQSHLLLRCLRELRVVPPKLEDVITRNCPSQIDHTDRCSSNCIKGILTIFSLCNLTQNSISLVINFVSDPMLNEIDHILTMLRLLRKCKSVDRVTLAWPNVLDLSRLLAAMHIGQPDSFIQHVRIHNPMAYRETYPAVQPFEDLPFGEHTRGMELNYIYFTNLCISFLRTAQNKPLTTFGISGPELSDECVELMSTVLKNPLLQNVSVRPPKAHRTKLISLLADLKDLRSLEMDTIYSYMNEEDVMNFERLLQNQTLHKLTLINCQFSKEVCNLFSHNFQTMPFLTNICLRYGRIDYNEGFGELLLAAHHLQTFKIDCFRLSSKNIDILCEVLPKLAKLSALRCSWISQDKDVNACIEACIPAQEQRTKLPNRPIIARQKLLAAIAECERLEFLSLGGMSMVIADDVVQELCTSVTSLQQLKHLCLCGNILTAIGLKQLSECLDRKPGKRVFLDIE